MRAPSRNLGWETWCSISYASEFVAEIYTHMEVSQRQTQVLEAQSTVGFRLAGNKSVTAAAEWLLVPKPLWLTPPFFVLPSYEHIL